MSDFFEGFDIIVIEDIEIVLCDREATQEEVSHVFLRAIENGKTIMVTGIDIESKAPYFYWKMAYMCVNQHKFIIC